MGLTLVFYHVSPLIGNAFIGLLSLFRSEDQQTLIFLDHISNCWPISAIFGHSWNREPEFSQASSIKHFGQALWRRNVVFNYDGHNLWWVCFKKCCNFFEFSNGRLLIYKSDYCRLHMRIWHSSFTIELHF